MTPSKWRDERNAVSAARLAKRLPEVFPAAVLVHAHSRPFLPPTPRLCIESYWRCHVLRADRLARTLASLGGAPAGWTWRLDSGESGAAATFRLPPSPYREEAFAGPPGVCRICGQPVFRFGWHRDLWNAGPNRNARWHACCVSAWKFWTAPSDHLRSLKLRQKRRCAATGARLLRDAEVDHRVPLHQVWHARAEHAWPAVLRFWGAPNLQVVNRAAHLAKTVSETTARSRSARARQTQADAVPSP